MVNPQDVFAPYWQRHWLDRDWAGCDVHPDAPEALNESRLRAHRNMRKLLRAAGAKPSSDGQIEAAKDLEFPTLAARSLGGRRHMPHKVANSGVADPLAYFPQVAEGNCA